MLHYDRKIKLSIVASRRIFLGFLLSRIKHFAIIVIRRRLDISSTFLNKKSLEGGGSIKQKNYWQGLKFFLPGGYPLAYFWLWYWLWWISNNSRVRIFNTFVWWIFFHARGFDHVWTNKSMSKHPSIYNSEILITFYHSWWIKSEIKVFWSMKR